MHSASSTQMGTSMKKGILFLLICLMVVIACGKREKVITSLDDAKDARIGVMTGSTGEAVAGARFPKAQVKSFDDIMDAVAAMKSGQLDAVITLFPAALQVVKKNPDFRVLAQPLDSEDNAIAIKKGNNELLAAVNGIISGLKADGTLADMKRRWLKPDLSPYEEKSITLPKTGRVLRIGVSATREPFSFVDKDGRVTGHDGELARIIGARLGRPIEFSDMKFMALIPALQSGKVDLIVTGMIATAERKKSVDFSQPYFANSQVMIVKKSGSEKNVGAKLASADDLKDKRIGVLLGSVHDTFATKKYPNATILQYKTPSDLLLAVKSGKVDAAFYTYETLLEIIRNDDELAFLGKPLFAVPIGMGFNKNNDGLREQFNRFLMEIKENGVYGDMVSHWITKGSTQTPVISNSKANGLLVVGIVSDKGLPFTIVKDNKMIGFDVELSERFAAYLGKELKLADMEFGSLIAAAATQKIDMIASTLMITEERKKQIAFSDKYYELGAGVFALKKNIAANGGIPSPANRASQSEVFSGLQQIDGKRICVLTGSAGDLAARKYFPRSSFMAMTASADAALALKSNKADAFIYDKSVLLNLARKNPELVILDEPVAKLEVAAAIKKENTQLLAEMNRALSDLKKEGALQRLRVKWVDSKYAAPPPLPPVNNAHATGVLKMGTCSTNEPFAFQANGIFTGLDVELSQMIGELLEKKIEIVDMNFEALIPALQSGKIDFALANFNVTEERKKLITFSLPYIENDISALVRRPAPPDQVQPGNGTAAAKRAPFLAGIASSFQSNIIQEKRYLLIWDGLKTTVVISVAATIFGTLLGALICFMRMSGKAVLNLPARVYIAILRGTPVLVVLMLIFYVVFASVNIDPVVVAVIAFGMNFAAYVAEIFRTGIEGVDKGQTEAGIAMGFTRVRTFLHIVLTQTVRRILPVYKGEFISLVKMTSIVGYIAVQDLTKASDIIRSRTFDAFFPLVMVAILYFLISWGLMQSLEYLERITDPKFKRRKAASP
jgi:polar amino acid transport system substrate-binding protein